jgi:hypothetical protein
MAKAKNNKDNDEDDGGTELDKHNQNKKQEVQARIARIQKARMMERAVTAQSGKTSLSRGDITVTYVGRPGSSGTGVGGAGIGGAAVGIIVWDPGADRDKAMEGDFDLTDGTIRMGDKDPTDQVIQVPKFPR